MSRPTPSREALQLTRAIAWAGRTEADVGVGHEDRDPWEPAYRSTLIYDLALLLDQMLAMAYWHGRFSARPVSDAEACERCV